MVVFLLECKEDEETQANLCRKEASSPLLESMMSITHGTILTLPYIDKNWIPDSWFKYQMLYIYTNNTPYILSIKVCKSNDNILHHL